MTHPFGSGCLSQSRSFPEPLTQGNYNLVCLFDSGSLPSLNRSQYVPTVQVDTSNA